MSIKGMYGSLAECQEYELKKALKNFRLMNPAERKAYKNKKLLKEKQAEEEKLIFTRQIML